MAAWKQVSLEEAKQHEKDTRHNSNNLGSYSISRRTGSYGEGGWLFPARALVHL